MFYFRLDAGIGHEIFLPALIGVGLIVGFIAGMFGVGGGFLLTPVLIYLFGVPAPVAVGSALCQQCGTSIASFFKYRRLGRGEPLIDLVMMGGSLIGVDAGTRLLRYLSGLPPLILGPTHRVPVINLTLDILFVVLLSLTALFIFREAWRARAEPTVRGDRTIPGPLITHVRIPPFIGLPRAGLAQVSVPMLGYIGFLLGLASGVMGIGGGVLFLPVLMYGFGLSARNAAGTGVLLLFVTVVFGTVQQALYGFVSLKLAMAILIGSSVGSQLGAMTTHRLPNRHLRLLFACLVGATVMLILWDLIGLLRRG